MGLDLRRSGEGVEAIRKAVIEAKIALLQPTRPNSTSNFRKASVINAKSRASIRATGPADPRPYHRAL
jgi:hypothetical protein